MIILQSLSKMFQSGFAVGEYIVIVFVNVSRAKTNIFFNLLDNENDETCKPPLAGSKRFTSDQKSENFG